MQHDIRNENNRTRLLRLPEVEGRTGLRRSTIYKRIAEGSFPRPVPLGGRLVAWQDHLIEDWIEDRVRDARGEEVAEG